MQGYNCDNIFQNMAFHETTYKKNTRAGFRPVNADPGLRVNRSKNFSCITMFFNSYALGTLK